MQNKQPNKMNTINLEEKQLEDGGIVHWCPNFLNTDEANELYNHLFEYLQFEQSVIYMKTKEIPLPRLQSWMADENIKASLYQKQKQKPWSDKVNIVRKRLESLLCCNFDYVLINLYRDGKDYISYHPDKEAVRDDCCIVARRFLLKHNQSKEIIEYSLTNGSLIVMAGTTQKYWKHSIPKELKVTQPRLNLTFRISDRK
jgi:alkylated DNA repair dioxygenase AlkB